MNLGTGRGDSLEIEKGNGEVFAKVAETEQIKHVPFDDRRPRHSSAPVVLRQNEM